MDVEHIREALAKWDGNVEPWGSLRDLVEAARLVVEAREVWWCENHDASGGPVWCSDRVTCEDPCVMVPARLLVPPKEKT